MAGVLQAQVPGAVMVRTSQATAVTLLLGNNGVQVKSLMPAASASATPPAAMASPSSATKITTAADAGCID